MVIMTCPKERFERNANGDNEGPQASYDCANEAEESARNSSEKYNSNDVGQALSAMNLGATGRRYQER